MQRIVPHIILEQPSNRRRQNSCNLENIGTLVETDSDCESETASEGRRSMVSTVPSESGRAGQSDKRVVRNIMLQASSRVIANDILDKFGQDYLTTLPTDLKNSSTGSYQSNKYTSAELGSIQDVLVRYESKAYDLLSRGRHDRALQTCKQLRALIRRLANEGVSDHHGHVAGAGHGDTGDGNSILLSLYAMAVESEALFLSGKLKRCKKRLLEMDAALDELSTSCDKPLSQLPRAVRCAIACYTMLGNLFSLEARRMRMNEDSENAADSHVASVASQEIEANYNSALDLSVQAFRHAVKLRREEGGNPGFGHTLLGEVLISQGNFVEATFEFQQALECALRAATNQTHEEQEINAIQERRNLGNVLLIRNNYAAALSQFTACVRSIAANCRRLSTEHKVLTFSVHNYAWCSEMLAQAAVCSTISSCLRALGQLDQAHAILEEAERMVLESGAMDDSKQMLHGTDSSISMVSSPRRSGTGSPGSSPVRSTPQEKGHPSGQDGEKQEGEEHDEERQDAESSDSAKEESTGSAPIIFGRRPSTFHSTPNRLHKVSLPSSLKVNASKHTSEVEDRGEDHRMHMSAIGVTTGEASLELLVRIAVERGHAHIRGGNWKFALVAYQKAETLLDMKMDDGVSCLDPSRAIALRGTIIMFLGDVFAYRVSTLVDAQQKIGGGSWESMYDSVELEEAQQDEEKNDDDDDLVMHQQQRYNGQQLYLRSMECYEQSYYMAVDVTDTTDPCRVTCLARIGQLHSLCRRWDQALPVLQRCLEQTQHISVIHRQLRAGLSIAIADVLLYGGDAQQQEAITLYTNALKLFHNSAGANCAEMGAAYLGIGRIWTTRDDHSNALRVRTF